jgi:hypothetical protein
VSSLSIASMRYEIVTILKMTAGLRFVYQIRRQPALSLFHRAGLSLRICLYLISSDSVNGEISCRLRIASHLA